MSDDGEDIPYYKYAFANIYNLSMLGGVASAAVLTQNWWLGVAGAGAEVLWMLFAPDSKLLRHTWFDKIHRDKKLEAEMAAFQQRFRGLSREHQERVADLQTKRHQIVALASENTALTNKLLKGEIDKLDTLMNSFVELIVSTERYETHLAGTDFKKLEAEISSLQRSLERAQGPQRDAAQKNLAILMKRREKLGEIMTFVASAKNQLSLIENSFDLLADQIVTMQSPHDLDAQLDELMDGVEAVKSTARETEALLEVAR